MDKVSVLNMASNLELTLEHFILAYPKKTAKEVYDLYEIYNQNSMSSGEIKKVYMFYIINKYGVWYIESVGDTKYLYHLHGAIVRETAVGSNVKGVYGIYDKYQFSFKNDVLLPELKLTGISLQEEISFLTRRKEINISEIESALAKVEVLFNKYSK